MEKITPALRQACVSQIILSVCGPLLLFLPEISFADTSSLSSSYEFGRRQITDFIENRDNLDNFDYFKYHLRLKQEVKDGLDYGVSYSRTKRDYETQNTLDSTANDYKLSLHLAAPAGTKLNFDFGHKEKHYKNSPTSEYIRDGLSFGLKRDVSKTFSLGLSSGIANYDFSEHTDSNQFKIFWALEADILLLENKLRTGASFRHQDVDQKGGRADRSEQIIKGDLRYTFGLNYLKDIGFGLEHGRDDTKEIEERDDNLRYRYTKWEIKSRHPLFEKLDTAFRYGQNMRDYFDSASDYRGWFLENKTTYEIFESKASSLESSFESGHKETDYHLDDSLNYIKDSFSVELSYSRKKNCKIIPSFTFSQYNYPADINRKEKDYLSEVEFIKELTLPDIKLKARYAYKFRDFRYVADVVQWWVSLGAALTF